MQKAKENLKRKKRKNRGAEIKIEKKLGKRVLEVMGKKMKRLKK